MDSRPPRTARRVLGRLTLGALLLGYVLWLVPMVLERQFQAGARAACEVLAARAEACRGFRVAGPGTPELDLILIGLVAGAMAVYHVLTTKR